jgi:hypothetical protein
MKQNIPQMRNMLNEVVKHFSSNPFELRSSNNGCFYNPPKDKPNSIGCAIGMYLPIKTAKVLDNDTSNITNILDTPKLSKLLPKWMQKMNGDFLQKIQSLHDYSDYWDDKGLTKYGKTEVNEIKRYLDKLEKYQNKLV